MKIIPLFSMFLLGFNVLASDADPEGAMTFDEVIGNGELHQEQIKAGFGTLKLISYLTNSQVDQAFKALSNLGKIGKIYAQILPPQNEDETNTTRFTMVAFRNTSFTTQVKTGELVFDRYSYAGIMGASPDYFRIVKLENSSSQN